MSMRYWTKSEEQVLKRMYPFNPMKDICHALSRNEGSIYSKAIDLNLKRTRSKAIMSYDIRILHSKSTSVIKQKHINASIRSRMIRKRIVSDWMKSYADKFRSGEWTMSIISGFENIEA